MVSVHVDHVLSCTDTRKVSQYPNIINILTVILAGQCVSTFLSAA